MIKCKSIFIIFLLHNLQLLWWNYVITYIFVHYYWKLSNYSSTNLNEKKKKRERNAMSWYLQLDSVFFCWIGWRRRWYDIMAWNGLCYICVRGLVTWWKYTHLFSRAGNTYTDETLKGNVMLLWVRKFIDILLKSL